ncbi:MAG: serine/threonine-protein kinase, partial [Myxococcota bacterium]
MSDQPSVMFIEGSQPLAHTEVRLVSSDSTMDGHVWRTDGEGRIQITLSAGPHTFEVGPEGIPHKVEVGPKQPSLMIVSVLTSRDTLEQSRSVSPTPSSSVSLVQGQLASTLDGLSDRYAFERVLGRGGMGVVFKARDLTLDRDVAMKVLSEELRELPEAQQIFMAEARALAGLHHEHLVTVHDVTSIDGVVVMVFEFVEGASLEAWLRHEGRVGFEDLLGLTVQLVSALVYLHGRGVIHRDIKPANVLVREDGVLKMIDFGLARSIEQIAMRGTRVRGTPAYMAPEQITGEEVTSASDIYQLGITLYELLCGELPFTSGDMGYAHLHLQPESLAARVPGAPAEFTALVDSCLAKDPVERPTAQELLEVLVALKRLGKTQTQGAGLLEYEEYVLEELVPV